MKVTVGPQSPLIPTITTTTTTLKRTRLALIGGAFGLFALGALGTALVLEGPKVVSEAPAMVSPATGPLAAKKNSASNSHEVASSRSVPLQTEPTTAVPPPCNTCGVVESSLAVQQKGQGTGLGAVAGGVLGGVVGHQLGGGSGKQALTVLGALGGGLAGNEIEKRQRASTAYQLKIRMADGSVRAITQGKALPVGQRVHVDGEQVTPMADNSGQGVKLLQTAGRS
jgi:outer membrane lipoprotein SlyB